MSKLIDRKASAINEWLDDVLSPIGLPCSEDPTSATEATPTYITWRQTSATALYASGAVLERRVWMTVTLYAALGYDHATTCAEIERRLLAAGAADARLSDVTWVAETSRRQCNIIVKVRCKG